jgi:hypothetical protein
MPTLETTISKITASVTENATYSATVTGLTLNQTYYVRAYAINSAGTAYSSNEVSVTPFSSDYVVLATAGIVVQTNELNYHANWTSANSLCANSTVGNYTDWRLPTISELYAIYSSIKGSFGSDYYHNYWSSTVAGGNAYYMFDGKSGLQYSSDASYDGVVRCVCTLP